MSIIYVESEYNRGTMKAAKYNYATEHDHAKRVFKEKTGIDYTDNTDTIVHFPTYFTSCGEGCFNCDTNGLFALLSDEEPATKNLYTVEHITPPENHNKEALA